MKFEDNSISDIAKNIKDNMPIAILVVTGDFRTGKSTILNLFIQVLEVLEKVGSIIIYILRSW